jgi:hypothetical protein
VFILLNRINIHLWNIEDMRHSLLIGNEIISPHKQTMPKSIHGRSRSEENIALKLPEDFSSHTLWTEEDFDILTKISLLTITMLESNLDTEFLIALNTVDKVFFTKRRIHRVSQFASCLPSGNPGTIFSQFYGINIDGYYIY